MLILKDSEIEDLKD
jgi:hypothetical protein